MSNTVSVQQSGWIPVAERLPLDGHRVIAWTVGVRPFEAQWQRGAWWNYDNSDGERVFPSHWREFPEPPESEP